MLGSAKRFPSRLNPLYRDNVEMGLQALRTYIEALDSLFEDPTSDEAFQGYMSSRATFVSSLPFCKDEASQASTPEHKQAMDYLRSSFGAERISRSDIDPIRRYESLLIELAKNMGAN